MAEKEEEKMRIGMIKSSLPEFIKLSQYSLKQYGKYLNEED